MIGLRSHWYHVAEVGFALVAHVFSTLSPFLKEVLNPQGACKSKGVWEARKAHTHTNTVQGQRDNYYNRGRNKIHVRSNILLGALNM